MATVLVLSKYYSPGYKGGGPIRSLENIIAYLHEDYQFRVITQDRDNDASQPYRGIEPGHWTRRENADVYYCPPQERGPLSLRRLVRDTAHDVIYINNLFDAQFGAIPFLLQLIGVFSPAPAVVATRGVLAPSALEGKAWKKEMFLGLARLLPRGQEVLWHASSAEEARRVRSSMGAEVDVHVASDLPSQFEGRIERTKPPNELRMLYLARITRMKNLLGALSVLRGLNISVSYDIYGPISDQDYWSQCRSEAESLPDNIALHYHGPINPAEVERTIHQHHVLFLPTLGENFGHAIFEVLSCARPVVISDQTPWKGLGHHGAGWALPVDDTAAFREAIRTYYEMEPEKFAQASAAARAYADSWKRDSNRIADNRRLFERASGAL